MHFMERRRKSRPSVATGLAGGLVAGLGATWVMTQAQQAMTKTLSRGNGQGSGDDEAGSSGDEPSTVKVASALSRTVTGRPVPEKRKAMAGQMVHYGFGTLMGGLYGVMVERDRRARSGFGLPFGTALFLGADEAALPALRLAPPPHKVPTSTHGYALAAHLVYGATAELLRRGVRRLI